MCTYSLLLISLSRPGLTSLLLTLALLQESLGNEDIILLGDLAGGMSETAVVRSFDPRGEVQLTHSILDWYR